MRPFCVEFRDSVLWVGMAKDAADATNSAVSYWKWQHGDGAVPTFTVYHLDVEDAND